MQSIARVLATTVAVALVVGCASGDEIAQVTATPIAAPSPSASPAPSPTDEPSSPAPSPEPSVAPSPTAAPPQPAPAPSPEPAPAPSPSPSPTASPSPEFDAEEARAREVVAAYDGRLVEDGTMMTVPNDQLFETGTIYISDEGDAIMEELLIPVGYYLDGDVQVRITVHTDNRDDPQYSRAFSQERADFTHKWFRDAGIPGPRMEAIGAGSSEPLPDADNGTAAGREANRRTEIVLVGVDAITE